tara:strand:+ start:190 stop:753 length:564 start_codon:yes stop_codon:yes gene_type:complete
MIDNKYETENGGLLDTIKNKFNEFSEYLNISTFTTIIIILLAIGLLAGAIIGYIIFKNNKHDHNEMKRKLDETLEKTTGIKNLIKDPKILVVDNKIDIKTKKEKKEFNLEQHKFKHVIFIKNINNSIQFCIENNKFDLAEQIEKFKTLYKKLYKLNNNKTANKTEIKKYIIQLNNIDKIIRKRLEMD